MRFFFWFVRLFVCFISSLLINILLLVYFSSLFVFDQMALPMYIFHCSLFALCTVRSHFDPLFPLFSHFASEICMDDCVNRMFSWMCQPLSMILKWSAGGRLYFGHFIPFFASIRVFYAFISHSVSECFRTKKKNVCILG